MSETPIQRPSARYQPEQREEYWQAYWTESGIYQFDPESERPVFSIDTPPPTISGALHLGHIYSYTQAEVIARYMRQRGYNVHYPFGMDNNGLPTERLVEKELGIRGKDVPLAQFVQSCLKVTEEYKTKYEQLWKRLGLSVDWRLEYSTISPEVQKIAQSAFKELFDQGAVYRKESPVIYCWECGTSIAQAEVEDQEVPTVFYDLTFRTPANEPLTIATTRPEFLPACVAVFVHPEDSRYQALVGKVVTTPLGKEVPVYADSKVVMDKGSGAVMCCTYGDETDILWVKEYHLPEVSLLDKKGKMTAAGDLPELVGLSVLDARAWMINHLHTLGVISGEKEITHRIGTHERCSTPIEILSTTQWFVKVLDIKEKLLELGSTIKWHPTYMHKRYNEWVMGLKWDWCISRERFYGIPIPVYYCNQCGKSIVPLSASFPLDPRTTSAGIHCPDCPDAPLIPETGVFDTWFTSSLTPHINNFSSHNGPLTGTMYPMSMRPQAHDIIRTWAFYSICMSYYRYDSAPWHHLMMSGHILTRGGQKISKKTGGGEFKPEALITEHSADAIRYAMCGASLGKDAYFDLSEVEKGKKLVTKLYNAGKLVLAYLKEYQPNPSFQESSLRPVDRWIVRQAKKTAQQMSQSLDTFEYNSALKAFEDFFWRLFCDNYLEIAKAALRTAEEKNDQATQTSVQYALYHSYLSILQMAAPYLPHIGEEMFHSQSLPGEDLFAIESKGEGGYFSQATQQRSIHTLLWPGQEEPLEDPEDEGAESMLRLISEIRRYKTAQQIKLSAPLPSLTVQIASEKAVALQPFSDDIAAVCRVEQLEFTERASSSSSHLIVVD